MRGGCGRTYIALLTMVALTLAGVFSSPPAVQAVDDDEVPITANYAVVIDADTGQVLFDHNKDEQVPIASLTKIFTAIVALESASIDTVMTVDRYDLVGEASIGLIAGERMPLESLVYGLMLTSGNDAAMTISRSLGYLPGDSPQQSVNRFMERVNNTAKRLGLHNTNLRNPHGLDQSGHISTAADVAGITMYAINNPIFRDVIATPYHQANGREMYNVNLLLDQYPGLIGGKTGVTTAAGHSLVQVAQQNGKTVIAVLLDSTADAWYIDAQYLLDLGFETLAESPSDPDRATVGLATSQSIDVPEVVDEPAVGGNVMVDRVNDNEAVVRSSSPLDSDSAFSWQWPVVSIVMMAAALLVALNFQAIIGMGALAFERSSRIRVNLPSMPSLPAMPSIPSVPTDRVMASITSIFSRPFRRRSRPERPFTSERATPFTDEPSVQPTKPAISRERASQSETWKPNATRAARIARSRPAVRDSGTSRYADEAIKYALQSRYHAAADAFLRALQDDSGIDLTKCPGFWRMQPMGYIAAAKAYRLNGQIADARRLLTVVQMAYHSNPELCGLFGRAINALDE